MDREIKTKEKTPKTPQTQSHSATPVGEVKRAQKFITSLNSMQA